MSANRNRRATLKSCEIREQTKGWGSTSCNAKKEGKSARQAKATGSPSCRTETLGVGQTSSAERVGKVITYWPQNSLSMFYSTITEVSP